MRSSLRRLSGPLGRLASVVTATVLLVGMAACAPMNSAPVATYPSYPAGPVYTGGSWVRITSTLVTRPYSTAPTEPPA